MIRALTVALLLLPAIALGEVRNNTFAYDYRNTPNVSRLLDRQIIIFSMRGMIAKRDSVPDYAGRVFALTQPNLAFTNGVAIGSRPGDEYIFPWDTAAYTLTQKHDAIMRDSTGNLLDMFGGTQWQSMVLDFRDSAFARDYASLMRERRFLGNLGVALDYGCGDLAWMALKVDPSTWPEWRQGWRYFLQELGTSSPRICQCDQWPRGFDSECDGILFERVGQGLNPFSKVWGIARSLPRERIVFLRQEDTQSRSRRAFATMSLLLPNAYYDQCQDPNVVPPVHLKNIEHFGLNIGDEGGDYWERSPGVFQRMYTRGLVILNTTNQPYRYSKYTIGPQDGFVAQTRDGKGRWMTWATNQ